MKKRSGNDNEEITENVALRKKKEREKVKKIWWNDRNSYLCNPNRNDGMAKKEREEERAKITKQIASKWGEKRGKESLI